MNFDNTSWVCAQPVTSPIVGARTSQQLADNLAALEFDLDDAHMQALNEVSKVELGYPQNLLARAAATLDGGMSISPSIESLI